MKHQTTFGRSPRSIVPNEAKGLASDSSSGTIKAFFANQGGNKVDKAMRVVAKEEERVRRVQRVRENALAIAVENQAKHILKEKKEAKNEKRYKEDRKVEQHYTQ